MTLPNDDALSLPPGTTQALPSTLSALDPPLSSPSDSKFNCNQQYIRVLNPQDFTTWKKDQKYFPTSIDWNALLYHNQTNANEFIRSFDVLQEDVVNHKNDLFADVFKSRITAF